MTNPTEFIATLPKTTTALSAGDGLRRSLYSLQNDLDRWSKVQSHVPEAWACRKDDLPDEEPKVKLTLRLDDNVNKMFRAAGPGYQARTHLVLGTCARMQT